MGTAPTLPKSREASGSQATSNNNSSTDAATNAATEDVRILGLKEHDYMGLSNTSKEHRRTRLQLGLPGSPDGEDPTTAATAGNAEPRQQPHQQQPQQPHQPPSASSSLEDPAHQSRAPVGWPPLQSFRKNSLTTSPQPSNKPSTADSTSTNSNAGRQSQQPQQPQGTSSLFVKVYMDGVPIGRKVNLRTHGSYDKLSVALEDMFRRFISGQAPTGGVKPAKEYSNLLLAECKKFNFMYGSEYVLTYEDRDGDLMLVGDVPWELFVGNVKRLRIMKGSEAIGLAVAPRTREDPAPPAAVGN